MNNQKHILGILISTLMSATLFTACSPQGLPNTNQGALSVPKLTIQPPSKNTSVKPVPLSNNTNKVIAAPAATQEIQDSLVSLHDEEAFYNDSLSIAQDDGGFSTQMLDTAPLQAQVNASLAKQANKAKVKAKIKRPIKKALKQARKANFEQPQETLDGFLNKSKTKHAIKINNKRIMIIDKAAFKKGLKDELQDKKAQFKKHRLKHKAKLKVKKKLAKAKLIKLKRQNQIVRNSEKISTQNDDGSTTETLQIHFENEKTGLTREITLAKTSLNDKPLRLEFNLEAKGKNHTRTASRIVTFNEDGSKQVIMESLTEWENGKTREIYQERILNADGSGSGTGTITITNPDGTVKTHQMGTTINNQGELSSEATDENTEAEVILEENAEGDATLTVEEADSETTETEVDLEAEAETEETKDGGETTETDSNEEETESSEGDSEALPEAEASSEPSESESEGDSESPPEEEGTEAAETAGDTET